MSCSVGKNTHWFVLNSTVVALFLFEKCAGWGKSPIWPWSASTGCFSFPLRWKTALHGSVIWSKVSANAVSGIKWRTVFEKRITPLILFSPLMCHYKRSPQCCEGCWLENNTRLFLKVSFELCVSVAFTFIPLNQQDGMDMVPHQKHWSPSADGSLTGLDQWRSLYCHRARGTGFVPVCDLAAAAAATFRLILFGPLIGCK